MQRSSIIATVIAAGGILIAGSVASVAVINAASSSEVQSTNLDLVADDAPASPAAVAPSASDASLPAAELPSLEASALPELPEVADPAAQPAAAPVQQAVKTSKSQGSDKPESEPSETAAPASPGISSDEARSIVMKQGDGVKTLAVSKDTRQGYKTWAVRIQRGNGEVITGYVDRESGVVVEWTVNSQAPAATTTTSGSSHEDDSQEAESEDHSGSDDSHESEDHESEDHESESDDD